MDQSESSSDSSPNLSPRISLDNKAVEEDVRNLANLKLMRCNDQIVALQTVIRDEYVLENCSSRRGSEGGNYSSFPFSR